MKNKTFTAKKSGFSLIELSIVLIIIGLLVAAITGGASLVKSAELRAVMGEARGFQVAVNSFYSQFDALPGDYSKVIGTSSSGNQNGQIAYATEHHIAWQHLKNSKIIEDNLVPTPLVGTSNQVIGTNIPASKLKSAGWAFDYVSESTDGLAATKSSMNAVILTGAITGVASAVLDIDETAAALTPAATNVAVASIPTTDALSIDTKVDDGKANQGSVRGLNVPTVNSAAISTTASCQEVTVVGTAGAGQTSSNYRTAYTTAPACALAFKVDPSAS